MAETPLTRIKDQVAENPATDRLKEELRGYLEARATHALTGLGERLGDSLNRLADPKQGAGGLVGSLAKGGQALSEGKSPGQAAMAVGTSHLKETLKDKVKQIFGKGRKGGGGKSKTVTISEDIDVGVPVREAYNQWTQFQEFSTFAKGVVSVDRSDDTTSNWKVKVAKSTRSWKANVTEQVPDERIAWTTTGAKGSVKGVVTFHRITDNLTRVLMVLEYHPQGLFEKTGNIWRAQGRRARLDLKLYRKFIMMRGEATDGWRGEIRDGEVVEDHDEAVEREEDEARETDADEREPQDGDDAQEDVRDEDEPDTEDDEARDDDGFEDDADEDDELPEDAEENEDEDRYEDEDPAEDELDDEDVEAEDEPLDDDRYEDDEAGDEQDAPRGGRSRRRVAAR
ncbi:SRPBCC family protein [Streptantibioticus parmotrematis]|uniref:SRPBCC family protein n=1 Tax=Streptantibioticus parmotrematis TaxID=2873249 RepID=UPI0033FCCCB1